MIFTHGSEFKSTHYEIRISDKNPGECINSIGYFLMSCLIELGNESYGAKLFTELAEATLFMRHRRMTEKNNLN